jgi:putative ABC transport system permease protein
MLGNYLKTTWRHLARHRILAFIHLAGLSVSMAACMLIFIWIHYQLSFDRSLKNAGDIYRVYSKILIKGNNFTSSMAPPPLADLLKREFPEVLAATRIWKYNNLTVGNEENGRKDKIFNEEVYQADSSFFQIFNYKILQGNPAASMTRPFTVVISRSTAIKYFGEEAFRNGSIPGKALTLTFGGWGKFPCKITGITEDVPPNAHFHYKIIFSNISDPWNRSQVWVDNTYYTYILLKDGTDPQIIESRIPAAIRSYLEPQLQTNFGTTCKDLKTNGNYWEYKLQPLTSIHLRSDFERELEPGDNIANVYILGAAAVFLLLMACINYANLSTAASIRRSKEIGVRKTLGSSRLDLVNLVFTESGIIALTAWIIALILIAVSIHPFGQLMKVSFPGSVLTNGLNWIIFAALFFAVSLLGGLFPALHLPSVDVIKAVKGNITPGSSMRGFKSTLVIIQFSIFIGLVICSVSVYRQLNYLRYRSPGFNKDNMVVVSDPSMLLGRRANTFIADLKKSTDILTANTCLDYPESGNDNFPISAKYNAQTQDHLLANFSAGYDFLKTFDIRLLQGRDFSREMDNDTLKRVILNEAAVKELGLPSPVGSFIDTKYLNALHIKTTRYEVIGVTEDFNFQSFHKAIRPAAVFLNTRGTYICIKIKGGNIASTLSFIQKTWQSFVPGAPFEFHFLDDSVNRLYTTESVLNNVLTILTVLTIFVAIMGLTGLTLLTVQQRTKEIGVRKVIGATTTDILLLFSKEYIKLVGVSFAIAVPIAFFAMHDWLQGFAYRTTIEWWIFVFAGLSALSITIGAISVQVINAAMANPVKSLRTE